MPWKTIRPPLIFKLSYGPETCLSQNCLVKKENNKASDFFSKIHAKIAEKQAFLFFLLTNLLHTF
jgi:hypothetical protein